MYIREIPVEYREEIKEIVKRNQNTVIRFGHLDLLKLMRYYYRFVGKLIAGKDLEQTVKQNINCGVCVGDVQKYFKEKVREW